jgi:hypothetical protein
VPVASGSPAQITSGDVGIRFGARASKAPHWRICGGDVWLPLSV